MYYIKPSYTNTIIEVFETKESAIEYILHHTLNEMVNKNDFVTLMRSPKYILVEYPIGFSREDSLYRISNIHLQNTQRLNHLIEYNEKYIENKKVYIKWLEQICRVVGTTPPLSY